MLLANTYGKGRVRLTKVVRNSNVHHDVYEFTVDVTLYGAFSDIYTADDNTNCVPTDTMKNTVYAVARKTEFSTPEHLAFAVAERLITRHEQITGVVIEVAAERWKRIEVDGSEHPHSFQKQHGQRTARVARGVAPLARPTGAGPGGYGATSGSDVASLEIVSGIRGMEVLKSAGSGFSNYTVDEYTALRETDDRILATTVLAEWGYGSGSFATDPSSDYDTVWNTIEASICSTFATHDSPSLQSTLNLMGENVLQAVPEVDWIRFLMPNQHHMMFDLERFGMTNEGEVFYGTDSPFGVIEGTVARGKG